MIKQISIFTENKKDSMRETTRVLAEQGISILALVTNDSAEFGIVRMVVSNQELAYDVLKKAGYMVHADTVIAVRIGDEPGSLDQLLLELLDSNVNVDYLYMSYDRKNAVPIAVIKTPYVYEVAECLIARGGKLLCRGETGLKRPF